MSSTECGVLTENPMAYSERDLIFFAAANPFAWKVLEYLVPGGVDTDGSIALSGHKDGHSMT